MLTPYRTSPHSVTGKIPFELLRGRKPSTGLVPWWLMERNWVKFGVFCDKVMKDKVLEYQLRTKLRHDTRPSLDDLVVGQSVRVKIPGIIEKGKPQWSEPRKIVKILRNAVKLDNGKVWNVRRISICREEDTGVTHGNESLDECSGYLFGNECAASVKALSSRETHVNVEEVARRGARDRRAPIYLNDHVTG
ncbi:hypothetical protein NDU88_004748 [Pleurodeles waltl]|uniref:Uncharacterized protein n=1 Tax=Pleurodeles waltl TaxID=8319 RepID=A0AAV7VL91_PLEWA|nr:hypothetical protein NDU88_004748 [Pleurodeles waltl]